MKNQTGILLFIILLLAGCTTPTTQPANESTEMKLSIVDEASRSDVVRALKEKYGQNQALRIETGVKQAADFWNGTDGTTDEFKAFCMEKFIGNEAELDLVFNRLSAALESLGGCYNKISVDLKLPLHLPLGDIHAVDEILGGYNPGAHFTDDMFENKLAFIVLLNFPFHDLEEKTDKGEGWTRKEWAYARMGELFTSRVPASLNQNISKTLTDADNYISGYNICMDKLRDNEGRQLFPDDLRLISHWGIRDELKSHFGEEGGLEKQKLIYQVMLRIINQEIPAVVINNNEVTWNPLSNEVFQGDAAADNTAEPGTRYEVLLKNFKALSATDAYQPFYPNQISRAFDEGMEITQEEVEKLFVELVSSPEVKKAGELISKRLGRPLEPFDIWYNGFKAGTSLNEAELNKITRAKYPDNKAFEKDMPNILVKLGFDKDSAAIIASRITVDPARGSGHAWGAEMRTDRARLRTRIGEQGMDYKGYNIAMHEFGHNVEQTLSLYNIDHYILHGVPNTAFTEALAFLFQRRDLAVLGIAREDPMENHLMALDNLWANYEIMGVSLVDMRVWKWLYEHPDATVPQLKDAVISIAKDVWNSYYAPVFGVNDTPILAIYSHMIDNPLYLSAYPVGHLIQFQVEQYMEGKKLPDEVYRMYTLGLLAPQVWMQQAVGQPVSIRPVLTAAGEAIKALGNR
ncbi:MAG: hypothetical protein KBC43_01580 [Bacteroidales bacterium]|nr:hypothetical protein [Bacteroidales bacterium]